MNGEAGMTYDGTTFNVTGDTNITGNAVVGSDGAGNLTVNGSFTAESKSFDIVHPTKEGYRLRYGVLEGPEHAVYFRGNTTEKVIELPDYWTGLVNPDTFTVQLTPIGKPTQHFIKGIEDNKVYIDSESGEVNVSYLIISERIDVEKIIVEYKA